MPTAVRLAHRGVLAVAGDDRKTFLQGLVSNDVLKLEPGRAMWSALLTPQGKFLHEFFIVETADALLLDCEGGERLEDLRKRLSLYKLRSKVTLTPRPDLAVWALLGDGLADGIAFVDPRLPEAGRRALLTTEPAGFDIGTLDDYDRTRIPLGLPDGSRDLVIEKSILLENGFEELKGVDFQKGCYMGQELTARTKYRGLIKKRLMPVVIEGPAPAPGTLLMASEVEVGEMRSSCGNMGLALVRLEHADKDLTAGGAALKPQRPAWMVVPA